MNATDHINVVFRKFAYSLMSTVIASPNSIVTAIVNSDAYQQSALTADLHARSPSIHYTVVYGWRACMEMDVVSVVYGWRACMEMEVVSVVYGWRACMEMEVQLLRPVCDRFPS